MTTTPQTNPLQTNAPKPTPYKPNIFPKWGQGTNPKQRRCLRWGQGTNPKQRRCPRWGWGTSKTKEVPKVGMGDKPKKYEVPKVGMWEAPMVPVKEPPQRNIKSEQDRKRCSKDTDGKNPHENKRVHRDTCVYDLV